MDRSVFELFRLDGKVAIVTGAHAWLGYDIACAFAEAGADVIITSRNVDSIRETAAQIGEKYHVDTLALPLDQRKYENVQKMADAALAWKGHIDILVNNAGGGSGKTEGDFLKRDPADIQNLIDINLTGSVFCSKAVGAMMAKAGCGKIINISSVWGVAGASCEVAYSATKGGINAFTKALAKELAPSGIQVNAIACGAIDTEMNHFLDQEELIDLIDEIPAGRLGKAEEVADLAYHLGYKDSYLTGQVIGLDGGWI